MTDSSHPDGTTALAAIEGFLDRIQRRDGDVAAWAFLDPESALATARARDAEWAASSPVHGWSVGLKDVIETSAMPTGYGSPIWKGHRPTDDASVVRALLSAGAIVLGKTTTTEFATFQPPATRNPHNLMHTPGGSSSGSAAAVADGQVRVAIGTQTAGSVVRPASYCGVFGFKPTYARWPLTGVQPLALSFDTLGAFARTMPDLLILDQVLAADAADTGLDRGSKGLRIGVLEQPGWDRAAPDARTTLHAVRDRLAEAQIAVHEIEPDSCFADLESAHTLTFLLEANYWLAPFMAPDPDGVSGRLRASLDDAASASARDVQDARSVLRRAREMVGRWFDSFDLILTLSAPGEAPAGVDWTGDPVFNRLASTVGCPAISVPAGHGEAGLPLGVQFLAAPHGDRVLLHCVNELLPVGQIGSVPVPLA
jgi:Asp-tRNA(Asn)/Glu-tRNA(Gln) amidotransferase A subunit family amidase